MKADRLAIEPSEQASFRCVRIREQPLVAAWHFHPEYQLTLIVRGTGQRMVGDSLAPLGPGDLTLVGPNLPHCWDVDPPAAGASRASSRHWARRQPVDAVIAQFRAEFLGREFWGVPETAAIVSLLTSSARGLRFSADATARVASAIMRLPKQRGLQRLLGLMTVLDSLAAAGGAPLASPRYKPRLDEADHERIAPAIQAIHDRLWTPAGPPGRTELAAISGLAERSFSRYFKMKVGRTLPDFINELRIGRARWLLETSSLPIARVARQCGFHNLSHFNSQFRRLVGTTPQRFRGRLARG